MTGDNKFVAFLGLSMSRETWDNFRWDFLASVLFSFFNVVFNQFYVPIAIRHGATDFQVGLLSAAPAVGLLFSPIWASLMENGSPKPYVVYPNLAARALILLPAFFAAPWVFVAAAFVFQMLMGIQAPAYAGLMTRVYPPALRGRLMGNVRVAMGSLMIPLVYLIGQWIDHSGSRWPLALGSVTGILSILLFSRVKETLAPAAAEQRGRGRTTLADQFRFVRRSRGLIIFLAGTTLAGFGNMVASPLYAIIQVDRLGLSNVEIGYVRMAYFACLLAAYLAAGWAIDRYPPQAAMCFGFAAFAIAPLLYGLIGTFPAVIVAGGVQGIGDAVWDIGCMACVFRIAPGRESMVFGIHLMLFGIRGTIGPLLSTAFLHSVPVPLLLGGASLFCWLGFLLFLFDKSGVPRSGQPVASHSA